MIVGLGAIMLAFLAIGSAWIAFADNIPWADADFYFRSAKSLAEGDGYLHPFRGDHPPTAFHPVGYPWLLAHVWRLLGIDTAACDVTSWPELNGCGAMVQAGQAANLLLATLNIGLVFVLASLIRSGRIALLAAALYAIIPSRLFFTSALMSEEAFVTVVLLALIALVIGVQKQQWLWPAAAGFGLAIAAATFIRPLGIVLLPLPLAFLLSKEINSRVPFTQLGIGTAVVLAMLIPWTLRNHNEVGGWNLVSNNGGINLWIGCHLNSDGGISSHGKWMDWWSGDAPAQINTADERANDRQAQSLALECMREEPFAFARLSLLKGLYTFREDWEYVSKWSINNDLPDRPVDGIVDKRAEEAFGYLANSVYLAMFPLAVIGSVAFFLGPSIYRGVIGAAFAGLALVPLAFFGDPRFHVPLLPIMSIWAAEGILILIHGLRSAGQHEATTLQFGDSSRAYDWRREPWLR